MKIMLLFLLLGVTVNLSAQDERWVFYGTIWNGDEYFYDKETIKHNTSSTEVWVKLVFKTYFYDNYHVYLIKVANSEMISTSFCINRAM